MTDLCAEPDTMASQGPGQPNSNGNGGGGDDYTRRMAELNARLAAARTEAAALTKWLNSTVLNFWL